MIRLFQQTSGGELQIARLQSPPQLPLPAARSHPSKMGPLTGGGGGGPDFTCRF